MHDDLNRRGIIFRELDGPLTLSCLRTLRLDKWTIQLGLPVGSRAGKGLGAHEERYAPGILPWSGGLGGPLDAALELLGASIAMVRTGVLVAAARLGGA